MYLDFNVARYKLRFRAVDSVNLPPYKGSTFRGAFGHALKAVCCSQHNADCADCLLQGACLFQTAFGSRQHRRDNAFFASYTEVPRPFIIEPPLEERLTYEPDDLLEVGLTLIGGAVDQLPFFIAAFAKMGQDGLGKGRGRLELIQVTAAEGSDKVVFDGNRIFPLSGFSLERVLEKVWDAYGQWNEFALNLELLTPLRIQEKGRLNSKIDPISLTKNVLRRASALAQYYGDGAISSEVIHSLLDLADSVTVGNQNVYWYDWNRFSSRQGTMKLGGLKGRLQFRGVPAGLLPWLVVGEIIHVGKGTTFGLGKYRISGLRA